MAAADASRAAQSHRCSRVVARALVHAAQVVGLVVLLRSLAEFPWASAAAQSILRFAAPFLVPQRLGFLAANILVIGLTALFLRDAASFLPSSAYPSGSPSSNSNSNGDAPEHPLLAFLVEASREEARAPPEEVVFEDKEAVHVKTKARAQPPRRTMSDKTRGGGAAAAAGLTSTETAAPPELRRAKSENTRRRQRRSAAAAAAPVELGADDAEAFRQAVEAFIAKQQTLFRREESLVVARAAAAARGEDGPALAAGAAAVAVK